MRALRSSPQDRKVQLLSMAGVVLGMVGGVAALMPHAPLK